MPDTNSTAVDVFYFGCDNSQVGHFSWGWERRTGRVRKYAEDALTDLGSLDTAYCPGVEFIRGTIRSPKVQTEGLAKLSRVAGWTVIAWWDRSVDKRGGSNMVFGARGELSATGILAHAIEAFPLIIGRLTYPITLNGVVALAPRCAQ